MTKDRKKSPIPSKTGMNAKTPGIAFCCKYSAKLCAAKIQLEGPLHSDTCIFSHLAPLKKLGSKVFNAKPGKNILISTHFLPVGDTRKQGVQKLFRGKAGNVSNRVSAKWMFWATLACHWSSASGMNWPRDSQNGLLHASITNHVVDCWPVPAVSITIMREYSKHCCKFGLAVPRKAKTGPFCPHDIAQGLKELNTEHYQEFAKQEREQCIN